MSSSFIVPYPFVNLTAPIIQNFGEPLTLTCEVETVKGITGSVSIRWYSYYRGTEKLVENVTGSVMENSVIYRDLYKISRVVEEDVIACYGIINSSRSQTSNRDIIRLILTCELL